MNMVASFTTMMSGLARRPSLVHALDDAVAVAGAAALLPALRDLALPHHAFGLFVLAVLALAVRTFPLVRSYDAADPTQALVMTASTPLLAIMALYGAVWATVIAVAAVAIETACCLRRRLDPEYWARAMARTALAMVLAGAAFTALRGVPGPQYLSLELTLPALLAAEVALTLAAWLLAAPCYVVATGTPYRQLARESLLGSLPALAAEPVLGLVLAAAAITPTPATLLAAVLPLAGLIAAMRLHTDIRGRLERAHTALSQAHAHLLVQATTDALTGLANRRLFEEMLAARLEEASRYGRPLAVLLLDLDGFKSINDTYGHAAGDAVLVAVAGALRRGLRRSDLPARLAGDEFVAILPETSGARALALAERVCKEVSNLKVTAGTATIRPSASVGAASTDGLGGLDPAGLLAAADGAAYTAKAAGKNAARLAGTALRAGRRLPARQRARIAP